jgi:hypothetical protein
MKLTQELTFFAKLIDKWIVSTPFNIGDKRYVLSLGKIYSDLIFQNEQTWNLLDNVYANLQQKDDMSQAALLVWSASEWKELDIEDINTIDIVWNVAGIEWTEFWIDLDTFHNLRSLITKAWFYDIKMRFNPKWMIAFLQYNYKEMSEQLFAITPLQIVQKSLFD